jgi:hypothetical protein
VKALPPLTLSAVDMRSCFTWFGVAFGCCEMISAAAPDTTAVACELPLPRMSRSLMTPSAPAF